MVIGGLEVLRQKISTTAKIKAGNVRTNLRLRIIFSLMIQQVG